MKKKVIGLLIIASVVALTIATAFAYGEATFEENGIKYTATDGCGYMTKYIGTSPYGYWWEDVNAHCDITPTIRHYSTADIRKSRIGAVHATSGRCWSDTKTSSAHCGNKIPDLDYKGYGWWGH